MRILHVYKDYYPVLGGIENHVRLLATAQARLGHEVTVLVTSLSGKTVHVREEAHIIKAARLATLVSTPISLALPLILSRQRPDITHLHFPYPGGEVSHLLFGKAPRTIITYHSDIIRQHNILKLYRPLLLKVLEKADRIIVSSEQYARSSPFLARFRDKCDTIPLGIDLKPFLDVPRHRSEALRAEFGSPLVLFVGRLRYYKGLQYLIQAMPHVAARLLIVGTGPMEAEWRGLAAALGLGAQKVTFLGDVSEGQLAACYHAASVFVLPACERSEAFGVVQVEAMASRLPVVSTELGTGTSFVNLHGTTGLVVPPKDARALAQAVTTLLSHEDLRRGMGARGRQRAIAEFSLPAMVARTMHVYGEAR